MKGFCQHCGRELNGDEPFCPDCGSPTGPAPSPTYSAPPKKSTNMWIIIFALIVAGSILAVAIIPMLLEDTGDYKVTVTIDEFSITLDDLTQYEGSGTHANVILSLSFNNGVTDVSKELTLYHNYYLNSGVKVPTKDKGFTFTAKGDPNDIKYTAFMYIERTYMGFHPETTNDMIDLYSVDMTKIVGSSSYYGNTGISFNSEDFTGNSVELKGDSDPIGYVKLTITSVKI